MKTKPFFAVPVFGESCKANRLLTLLLASWFLAFAPNIRADYTATVNPGSIIVSNYLGWGTSLCWWANVTGGYPNRNTYADLAFTQLKLNIVRYNVGGGENPSLSGTLTYRTAVPGFEPTNGVWNWSADLNQRWMLQAALSRGANLVDAFANSPPWWMTVSGSVTGAVGGTNNLQTAYQTPFASYLANVVSNLTKLDGVHFDYITPLNEPSDAWTYDKSNQEGCHMSTGQQAPVLNALRAALNTSLPSIGIDAPSDYDELQSYNDLNSYSATTLNNIALCTTHTYKANDAATLSSKVRAIGKSLWVSEYGDNDGTGLTMAQRIHDDITAMGVRGWCYWQVVDSAGGWGFLYNPLTTNSNGTITSTSYTINEKFYAMGQFSEYVRPGCEIISVNDANTLAAYTPSNSTLVLVIVNTNTNSFNVTYNLSAFGARPWQVAVTQTAAGENMAALPAIPVISNQFTSLIPAKSVTTFVLTTNGNPPVILSQSPGTNGMQLYAGQAPTFSVNATGSVPFYYKWLFNGSVVAFTTNSSFAPAAAQLASVTNVVCIVSNYFGSTGSVPWSLAFVPQPTAAYPRAVLALNPIDYWRLDETPDNHSGDNGTICHDYAGGNNGVYSNVVLGQTGYSQLVERTETSTLFGTVLSSNSAASRINGPDFSTPSGSNAEFTVAAWVNGTGYQQTVNSGIVTKGNFYGEEMTIDQGAPGTCLRFSVRAAVGTVFSANSSINISTNTGWHHVVGVCDEARSSILLYVDGTLAGSAAIPAKSGITNASNVPLAIGARASSTNGYDKQFVGLIDDVAIYNYPLSSNQVPTLYQAGVSLPPVGLTLTRADASHLQCDWNYGILQSATNVIGPFRDLTNVTAPCTITISNMGQAFYRVREN